MFAFTFGRIFILTSLAAVFLLAGCGSQNADVQVDTKVDSSNSSNDLTPSGGVSVDVEGNVEVTPLDSSRVAEVEEKSGFDLPKDARIFTSVDNKSAYLFSFYTNQSVDDLKSYFETEFSSKGYSLKRDWTSYTIQQYTSATALYSKGGKSVLIAIDDQDGQRLVNMTRDY